MRASETTLHPDFDLVLHKPLDLDFVEMVKRLVYDSKA